MAMLGALRAQRACLLHSARMEDGLCRRGDQRAEALRLYPEGHGEGDGCVPHFKN